MKKSRKNIQLTSVAPFENGMLLLNKGYYICGGIGAVVGLMSGGIAAAALATVVGVVIWYLLKLTLAQWMWWNLRKCTFKMDKEVPYDKLVAQLIPALSYELTADKRNDGSYDVTYKKVRLHVRYNGDGTFSMPWQQNLISRCFNVRYNTIYKNTVMVMSILGYHIQQICSNLSEQVVVNRDQTHPVTDGITCSNCGAALSDEAKFCHGCGNTVVLKGKNNCCPNCGGEYNEGAAFCGNCGEKIN